MARDTSKEAQRAGGEAVSIDLAELLACCSPYEACEEQGTDGRSASRERHADVALYQACQHRARKCKDVQ